MVAPCVLLLRFPVTAVPKALDRYAEIADALVLGGSTKEEKVRTALRSMLQRLSCHACIEHAGLC
jgi:alcohol dehydrogenase class IV